MIDREKVIKALYDLVNTRRLEIILKYLNFIKILERIFTFKPPPVRQRTIIWVFGYLGIWVFRVKT